MKSTVAGTFGNGGDFDWGTGTGLRRGRRKLVIVVRIGGGSAVVAAEFWRRSRRDGEVGGRLVAWRCCGLRSVIVEDGLALAMEASGGRVIAGSGCGVAGVAWMVEGCRPKLGLGLKSCIGHVSVGFWDGVRGVRHGNGECKLIENIWKERTRTRTRCTIAVEWLWSLLELCEKGTTSSP